MRKLYKKKDNSPVRKKEIDIAKGIGIIAVVYGHTFTSLGLYIYIFHLPLFFVISGFLYASKDKEPLMPYVKNKIHSLLIPYFIFLALTNALLFGLYALRSLNSTMVPAGIAMGDCDLQADRHIRAV
jgi:fucose 4-O-acetylase-like acetyltransferase